METLKSRLAGVKGRGLNPMDIGIARWLRDNRSIRDAAVFLRDFGWSVDAARCILLRVIGSDRK